ncbi:MAG: Uma2 family endonuclease [Okeania sp. SIO3C4]|nr:Uma2 family endonuclease [Okeania sp. SIO3C4]
MDKFILYIPESIQFSEEQLLTLLEGNRDLRIETDAKQNLIILPPTDLQTGKINAALTYEFGKWNISANRGLVFGSSTGFTFPDGSIKAPDVSFVSHAQAETITEKDKQGFAHIAPQFVLELRSASDKKQDVIEKMELYMENDCKLGWLIDPLELDYMIFRPKTPVETHDLTSETEIYGEDILPEFVLKWREIDR